MFFKVPRSVLVDALEKRVEALKKELEGQSGEQRFNTESTLSLHEAMVKLLKGENRPNRLIRMVRPGANWCRWPESYAMVVALMHYAWKEFGEYMAACEDYFKAEDAAEASA